MQANIRTSNLTYNLGKSVIYCLNDELHIIFSSNTYKKSQVFNSAVFSKYYELLNKLNC